MTANTESPKFIVEHDQDHIDMWESSSIVNADQLYDALRKIMAQDNITWMSYIWRKSGFYSNFGRTDEIRKLLGDASKFMDRVVYSSPFFLRFSFGFDDEKCKMLVSVDDDDLFLAYFGRSSYELDNLLKPRQGYGDEDPPVDQSMLDGLKDVRDRAYEKLDIFRDSTWQSLAVILAGFGFAMENSEHPTMRYLVPASES